MKTKAWVLVEINKLELLDIELPPLQEGQALVEIHYTSICGSQINEIYGRKGEDRFLPHLLGHECVGKVLEIKGETEIKPADVVLGTWIGRGLFHSSPKYIKRTNGSIINAGPITTFSQHSIISNSKLIPIEVPEILPEHAMLGCAVPTGAGSLRYCNGDTVAIVGLGGVGLACALEAKRRGLKVIALEPNQWKREYAENNGISTRWISDGDNNGLGFESFAFVFESSGTKSGMETAFRAVKPGGILALAGNLEKGKTIEIDPFKFIQQVSIKGVVGGGCSSRDILDMVSTASVFSPLITAEYAFGSLDKAAEDLAAGKIIKPIIRCHE